jgi:hypothetical protein
MSVDVETRLRAFGEQIERGVAHVGIDEVFAATTSIGDVSEPVNVEVTLVGGDQPAATHTRRPRWPIVAVAAAGVVAVAGIALAATSDDDNGQPPAPVATISVAPTTNVAPMETVAPVTPEWRFSSVEIDPRAAELNIKIVVVMPDELVEYDTGSGERASIPIQLSDGVWPSLGAGRDWIRLELGLPYSPGPIDLYQGRESPVHIATSDHTERQPGTDLFWTFENSNPSGIAPDNPGPQRVHETDIAGRQTGVSFDLGQYEFLMTDPAGGFLVQAPDGGTYHLDPETGASRLITNGELIALNAETAVYADCGAEGVPSDETADAHISDASCRLVVLDRLTGEAHPVTPDHMPQYLQFRGEISPNNRYAPVNYRNGILGVIDLTTGETTYLQGAGGWWSPDGSRLVYVRNPGMSMGPIAQPIPSWNYEDPEPRLVMYDFDDGVEIPIVPDSAGLIAFAVRT